MDAVDCGLSKSETVWVNITASRLKGRCKPPIGIGYYEACDTLGLKLLLPTSWELRRTWPKILSMSEIAPSYLLEDQSESGI